MFQFSFPRFADAAVSAVAEADLAAEARRTLAAAKQERRTAVVLDALADALVGEAGEHIRFALVPPRYVTDFFATVAFTFPGNAPAASSGAPVLIEIDTFVFVGGTQPTLRALALAIATVADALRLCPTVTGARGYHATARLSRDRDFAAVRADEADEADESVEAVEAAAPGVAITYDFGFSGLGLMDAPTTLFLTLDAIAKSDPAALADRILLCAPRYGEPGYATPEKRLRTVKEHARFVSVMCLAPDPKGATAFKRARRTLTL